MPKQIKLYYFNKNNIVYYSWHFKMYHAYGHDLRDAHNIEMCVCVCVKFTEKKRKNV